MLGSVGCLASVVAVYVLVAACCPQAGPRCVRRVPRECCIVWVAAIACAAKFFD